MKRGAWLVAGSLSAGVGTLLAGLGLIATAGLLISRAAERPPILDLMLLFVAVRFFGITRPALRYLERLASHDLMFRLLRVVRRWFIGTLMNLSPGQLAEYRAGDLLSRMAADVDALQESYLRVVAPALLACAVTAAVFVAVATFDLVMAVVIVVALVAYGVGWSWFAYRHSCVSGGRRNDARRAFSTRLVAVLQASDDIVTCSAEGRVGADLAQVQARLDTIDGRDGLMLGVHAAMGVLVTLLTAWVVLALCLDAVAAGRLDAVWVAPLVLATLAAFEAVEGLPAAWQAGAQTRDSATRVLEVVRTAPAVVEVAHPLRLGPTAPSLHLDRVTFGYTPQQPVLRDFSLHVPPGQHVAIAGPTGSGKSTLLALLARHWDPAEGCVRVDGIDLRVADLDDLRAHVALLPQQVHVFNETLRDNVRIARRRVSDAQVRRVLERAGLSSFLARAGDGLDTRLGEHGLRMSAGERQRLALARVLLTDATVILADEPTAHLDEAHEREFLMVLRSWAARRTLLIASHRPATLEFVDRVIRLS